ncbi:hypothetical protein [Paenibacillus sp. AR247]|uniref:hypothetical protein n=1 Tax=Paenibacillus sp. AR247 TaxID=1631599 RepID=UPI0021578DAB|nr:hypothetical protein [Paenibacillus sp. AR247]
MVKKAKMLSLILACMLAFSVTACSKSDETSKDSADGDTLSFSVTLPSSGVDNENSMIGKEWKKQMEAKLGKKLNIKLIIFRHRNMTKK